MNENKFNNARFTLTLWYELFLLLIVLIFSVVLYTTEITNFGRVVLQRNFGNRPPRVLTFSEVEELQEQVQELRRSFIFDLILLDGFILFVGGGLSYVLAGKTLEPIRETFEEQKKFLANASHEFRTPLAAIQTAIEVALRSKTKSKEDYKKVLQQTLQESTRLATIADELLMLSRIDAGIAKVQFVPLDLSVLIEETLNEIEPLLSEKKLQLVKKIHPHVIMEGDQNRLKQLLLILLDNAVKFSKEKGIITVELHKTPKITLIVSDTGIGISQNDLPNIFERFYQVDEARQGNSAGLGLSIASWIASSHEALIDVKSTLGKGSSFIITFAPRRK